MGKARKNRTLQQQILKIGIYQQRTKEKHRKILEILENTEKYWKNRYFPTKNQGKIGIYLQRTKVAHLANVPVLRNKYGKIFGKSRFTG